MTEQTFTAHEGEVMFTEEMVSIPAAEYEALRKQIAAYRDVLRWIAQTVHQGYHTDTPGTWRECPRSVRAAVRDAVGANYGLPEEPR